MSKRPLLVASGPSSVSGDAGSPIASAAMRSVNSAENSSYTSPWTMNRFALMHACPLFVVRAFTAISTAVVTSADGITMNASEPPSSSTAFFSTSPAAAAMARPAASEPVSVTAATRASRITSSTRDAPIKRDENAPSGKPARVNSAPR